MTGDIPSGVMSMLDISDRPSAYQPLRDDGCALFAESDYDVRAASEDEAEHLMLHPALRAVRLARIENGETRAIVFNVEHYHVAAINGADDDFFEAVWDALVARGFEPFDVKENA